MKPITRDITQFITRNSIAGALYYQLYTLLNNEIITKVVEPVAEKLVILHAASEIKA